MVKRLHQSVREAGRPVCTIEPPVYEYEAALPEG